jgi:hypothetical protein
LARQTEELSQHLATALLQQLPFLQQMSLPLGQRAVL